MYYDLEEIYDVEQFRIFKKGMTPMYNKHGYITCDTDVLPDFLSRRTTHFLSKIGNHDEYDCYYFRSIKVKGKMPSSEIINLRNRAKKALNLDIIHYTINSEMNIDFYFRIPSDRIDALISIWTH